MNKLNKQDRCHKSSIEKCKLANPGGGILVF